MRTTGRIQLRGTFRSVGRDTGYAQYCQVVVFIMALCGTYSVEAEIECPEPHLLEGINSDTSNAVSAMGAFIETLLSEHGREFEADSIGDLLAVKKSELEAEFPHANQKLLTHNLLSMYCSRMAVLPSDTVTRLELDPVELVEQTLDDHRKEEISKRLSQKLDHGRQTSPGPPRPRPGAEIR